TGSQTLRRVGQREADPVNTKIHEGHEDPRRNEATAALNRLRAKRRTKSMCTALTQPRGRSLRNPAAWYLGVEIPTFLGGFASLRRDSEKAQLMLRLTW